MVSASHAHNHGGKVVVVNADGGILHDEKIRERGIVYKSQE